MLTDTFVLIQIPQVCKTLQLQLKFTERVTDLIYRALGKIGILEMKDYHLFGQNKNYLEIPLNSSCRDFFLEQYDNLFLIRGDPFLVEVYYESTCCQVSVFQTTTYYDIITNALNCLRLSDVAENFVAFNASLERIERLDKPVSTTTIILRSHNFFGKGYVFSTNKELGSSQNEFNMILVSKMTNPISLRTLFTQLRKNRSRKFEIAPISETKIQQLVQEFQSPVGTEHYELSDLCCCLFLFIRLSGKPLISEELIVMGIDLLKEDDFVFRIQGWLNLLPLSTHSLIIEICQSFGGDLEFPGARDLINIFRSTFFGNNLKHVELTHLIENLFLFSPIFTFFTNRKNFQLKKLKNDYVVVESNPDSGEIVYGRKGIVKDYADISDKIDILSVENSVKLLFAKPQLSSSEASDVFTHLNGSLHRLDESITRSDEFCSMLHDFLKSLETDVNDDNDFEVNK